MVKGRKVLCINSCHLVKDSNKKIQFQKAALLHFHLLLMKSFGHRLKTVFNPHMNILFRIFTGIFANTQDLLVTTLVFLGILCFMALPRTDGGKSY